MATLNSIRPSVRQLRPKPTQATSKQNGTTLTLGKQSCSDCENLSTYCFSGQNSACYHVRAGTYAVVATHSAEGGAAASLSGSLAALLASSFANVSAALCVPLTSLLLLEVQAIAGSWKKGHAAPPMLTHDPRKMKYEATRRNYKIIAGLSCTSLSAKTCATHCGDHAHVDNTIRIHVSRISDTAKIAQPRTPGLQASCVSDGTPSDPLHVQACPLLCPPCPPPPGKI